MRLGHGGQLPISCNSLGIVRQGLLMGTSWQNHILWNVGCALWKHVYCADVWSPSLNKFARQCANAKRLVWKYVDSCKTTNGFAGGKSGRDKSFKYTNSETWADSCTTNVQDQAVQVITDVDQLPEDLKDYHKTYGLCHDAALTA